VNAIQDRYEQLKVTRQCVDFDDMIDRTLALLNRSSASWLLKKLDGGIDHILVDEAQDTSAAQWEIIERVTEDFFSGEGQSKRPRTIFVVGDEKQSIFSFQGAQPELFSLKRKAFAQRIEGAGRKFEPVDLHLSFRSAPGVLAAVDTVFATPERSRGLSARQDHVPTVHEAWKGELPSVIEVWDVISPQEREPKRNWKLPLDYRDETDPAVASARRIAVVIAKWLREGEAVATGSQRRPIQPGDIMILVRRRDAFFEAMIRALKEQEVPTAGSDRLDLARHIAVMDLLAIGRAALLPEDDLNLATVLKTPLFGLSDEDLLVLAPNRQGSLFDSLRASASPVHQAACSRIELFARMARAFTPFDFFTRVLGPTGGRRAILARLGPESSDVLDEFLNLALSHESKGVPGLHAFIGEVESSNGTIKRDLDNSDSQVRVMTIHAAKGLEGKIVFLPDVCATPTNRLDLPIFALDVGMGQRLPVWSPRKERDCSQVALLRTERREASLEEYRRLLYVALTRAEERLYIAGHQGKIAFTPESWRAMIEQSLGVEAVQAPAPWGNGESVLRFGSENPPGDPCPRALPHRPSVASALPGWLTSPVSGDDREVSVLQPSKDQDANIRSIGPAKGQRKTAMFRGRAVHGLLQTLPEATPDNIKLAALNYLKLTEIDEDTSEIIDHLLEIFESELIKPLFSESAIVEIPINADVIINGKTFIISGVIDRLAVTEDTVYIGEFKTGKPSAGHDRQIALYHAALKQIYSERAIRGFVIYVDGPQIQEITAARMERALNVAFD
jgi:ATP-dependent helicase/nuclease subunit A